MYIKFKVKETIISIEIISKKENTFNTTYIYIYTWQNQPRVNKSVTP